MYIFIYQLIEEIAKKTANMSLPLTVRDREREEGAGGRVIRTGQRTLR